MKLSKTKLSVLCSIIAVIAVFVCFQMVRADTGSNMYGYDWSSNIGWISLNDCSNVADSATCSPTGSYGVAVLPVAPGTVSGYAWSSNIGWITFNDPSCPTSACTPGAHVDWTNLNSDGSANIKGWARACTVYASGCSGALKNAAYLGSWDGYIALDSGSGGGSGGTWGLHINKDTTISGFAWGSEVIGWIKSISSAVYLNGPTAQLTANPASILKGASSTLTVTATNIGGANSCSFAGLASGLVMQQGASGVWTGTVSVSPASSTLYTAICTKGSQSAKASTTVTVMFIATPSAGCTTAPCPPPTCNASGCNTPSAPGGATGTGSGVSGGYCAINNPQLAWDSDAAQCTISEQGGGSVTVEGSSKAEGGTLASDGLYYATVNLPVAGANTTYTMQCTGGSQLGPTSVIVRACQKDFAIVPSPSSQTLAPSPDGKSMIATFTVSVVPQDGFTGPVDISILSWPTNPALPTTRTGTFDITTLTFNATTAAYNTATLTISIPTVDLKQTATYSPIVIQGVSGTLTRTAHVAVGSTVKLQPVFKEF